MICHSSIDHDKYIVILHSLQDPFFEGRRRDYLKRHSHGPDQWLQPNRSMRHGFDGLSYCDETDGFLSTKGLL